MRVNELAKELGKSSKEVLEILQKHNQDVKTHSSSVSEEQIGMVKRAVSSHKTETAVGQGAQTVRAAAAGTPAPAETRTVPAETKAAPAEAKPAAAAGEAPKKKIAAVYRPQNSQQRPQRPRASREQDRQVRGEDPRASHRHPWECVPSYSRLRQEARESLRCRLRPSL